MLLIEALLTQSMAIKTPMIAMMLIAMMLIEELLIKMHSLKCQQSHGLLIEMLLIVILCNEMFLIAKALLVGMVFIENDHH